MANGDIENASGKPAAGQSVVIRTPDGACPARVFAPGGEGQWPAVILFMDGYGLRQTLFDMGQRLADQGFVVLLPDMFYRAGPYPPATPDEISDPARLHARLGSWIASIDNLKAAADAGAFLAYLDSRSDVRGRRVGVVGYCMGGGMALAAAGTHPERIFAAASFHGGGLASDAATSPHLLAGGMKGRILVAAADQDPYFPPEMSERLEVAFRKAGVNYIIEIYDGVQHGWTMPDFPVYDHAAAERHWEALRSLYRETLG